MRRRHPTPGVPLGQGLSFVSVVLGWLLFRVPVIPSFAIRRDIPDKTYPGSYFSFQRWLCGRIFFPIIVPFCDFAYYAYHQCDGGTSFNIASVRWVFFFLVSAFSHIREIGHNTGAESNHNKDSSISKPQTRFRVPFLSRRGRSVSIPDTRRSFCCWVVG